MSWRVRGGLLMYRFRAGVLEVFLAHPSAPPDSLEETGEWVIPKGGQKESETLLQAAQREYEEELGITPAGPFADLGTVMQKNGKAVHCWAFQGEWDDLQPIRSGLIEVEHPPGSGKFLQLPEFDAARFFSLSEARKKLRKSHRPLLDQLATALGIITDTLP